MIKPEDRDLFKVTDDPQDSGRCHARFVPHALRTTPARRRSTSAREICARWAPPPPSHDDPRTRSPSVSSPRANQSAADIAGQMAEFISRAAHRLDLAVYDCRLDEEPANRSAMPSRTASTRRQVRLIYDDSMKKPQSHDQFASIGGDFAEAGRTSGSPSLACPMT